MTTARKLIYAALRLIGVEIPSSFKLDSHLVSVNNLISSWAVDDLIVYAVVRENFTLSVGENEYTIGSNGDFNTVRPTEILEGAFIRDSGNADYPLTPMTRLQYNQIASKIAGGRPSRLYYEPEYPLGKIRFNYEPTTAEELYIDSQKPFTEFSTLDTSISFPPEYKLALQYNLAIALAPEYPETKVSRAVALFADTSLKAIKTNNSEPTEEVDIDPILLYRLRR